MKRTLRLVGVAAMVLLLAASCKKDEKNNGEKQMMTFSAGIEQTGAKTGLQSGDEAHAFKQVWTPNDAINVNGTPLTVSINPDDNTQGTFTGEVTATGKYYAVYPTSATLSGSTATFTLPQTQTYICNETTGVTYASNLAPMAAYTENNELNFRNLCGLMELSLTGTNVTVTSLELRCDKPICGTATYNIDDSEPLAMAAEAGNMVSMDCSTGVPLNGTASFIFVLPPVGNGAFSLTVSYTAGANAIQMTKSLGNITIGASQVAYNTNPYELVGVNGTVTTGEATDVTSSGANVAYTVTPNGVSQARQHGVCYGTSENPSISDDAYTEATGSTYTASLNSLNANTTYHVRAYAIFERASRNEGDVVVYGEDKYFTTKQETPTTDARATIEEVRLGTNGFWVRGTISNTSGVAEVGVCYSTNPTPTYADGHSTINTSATSFSVDVNGLNFDTPYYYRSYINYNGGVAYGAVQTLTTEPDYHSSGSGTVSDTYYFSVSPTEKVVFSKGNLQYNAGLNEWRFAEHQYDVVSNTNNTAPHENYPVWIDLFGYGTSGQREFGQSYSCYQPWSCGARENYCHHDLRNTAADWGANPIVNGGGEPNTWYTLSYDECRYLMGVSSYNKRTNAENLRGLAMVEVRSDVFRPGVVILPDEWEKPEDIRFIPTHSSAAFTSNEYTISEWEIMEQNGAVFLPVSAMRSGPNTFYNWDTDGQWGQIYWLGTHQGPGYSKRMMLHLNNVDVTFGLEDGSNKNYAVPVRLVKTYRIK